MKRLFNIAYPALRVFTIKLGIVFTAMLFINFSYADAVDDATAEDVEDLCNEKAANALYKIADKKQYSEELRRKALERMSEVSRECAEASDQRLTQYHQKLISAAYKLTSLSEVESRRTAIEAFEYVMKQPESRQPSQGAVNKVQTLADLALNDEDTFIRLWAMEVMVIEHSKHPSVQSTLEAIAKSDPEAFVQETATNMLAELYSPE